MNQGIKWGLLMKKTEVKNLGKCTFTVTNHKVGLDYLETIHSNGFLQPIKATRISDEPYSLTDHILC